MDQVIPFFIDVSLEQKDNQINQNNNQNIQNIQNRNQRTLKCFPNFKVNFKNIPSFKFQDFINNKQKGSRRRTKNNRENESRKKPRKIKKTGS
jgi:hypothetical protein